MMRETYRERIVAIYWLYVYDATDGFLHDGRGVQQSRGGLLLYIDAEFCY
jgi:hypothetical protein